MSIKVQGSISTKTGICTAQDNPRLFMKAITVNQLRKIKPRYLTVNQDYPVILLSKIPTLVILPLESVTFILWTVLTPVPKKLNLPPPQNTVYMFSIFWIADSIFVKQFCSINPKIPECFQLLPVTQSDIVIHISHVGSQAKPS